MNVQLRREQNVCKNLLFFQACICATMRVSKNVRIELGKIVFVAVFLYHYIYDWD